jgi:hypothetical protein
MKIEVILTMYYLGQNVSDTLILNYLSKSGDFFAQYKEWLKNEKKVAINNGCAGCNANVMKYLKEYIGVSIDTSTIQKENQDAYLMKIGCIVNVGGVWYNWATIGKLSKTQVTEAINANPDYFMVMPKVAVKQAKKQTKKDVSNEQANDEANKELVNEATTTSVDITKGEANPVEETNGQDSTDNTSLGSDEVRQPQQVGNEIDDLF